MNVSHAKPYFGGLNTRSLLPSFVLRSDTGETEHWDFAHENFRRAQPDLLCLIHRRKETCNNNRILAPEESELLDRETQYSPKIGGHYGSTFK